MSGDRVPRRALTFPSGAVIDPSLEWLVTNGLGGYACGPVRGGLSRRFHGVLIAALAAPVGRLMCLNLLRTTARTAAGSCWLDHESIDALGSGTMFPTSFALEYGLPVWTFVTSGWTLEKRVVMPYRQNTTHVIFRLSAADAPLDLTLRPMFQIRPHEGLLNRETPPVRCRPAGWRDADQDVMGFEVVDDEGPSASSAGGATIKWLIAGGTPRHEEDATTATAEYAIEHARGYDYRGTLSSPGATTVHLRAGDEVSFTVSTEPWERVRAAAAGADLDAERARRASLLRAAGDPDGIAAELTLAADQFIVSPPDRRAAVPPGVAGGDGRSVIAGYHWFTDWGRDTMISLEGLTLVTGRHREAAAILRTFARHVRDGLIPNLFPEGEAEGLYHTADASLWFFHAVHRYVQATRDRVLLDELRPVLADIAEHHLRGTRFGIAVDDADGLLKQGAEGYQLTWMDAKVGDWVVTPRRGKAVEINALWYNALRLLADWAREAGDASAGERWHAQAGRAAASFNRRFWNPATQCLYDVVDTGTDDDAACRPNQLFAISLDYPVLDPARWPAVLATVVRDLLTPVGLRTLSPSHPDYRRTYDGDLHARDAAYHQGTVWPWLIGPFVDAWRRAFPEDLDRARDALAAFPDEMSKAGVGTLAEIFDAEPPFRARGCVSQAWSVAEVLRVWRLLNDVPVSTMEPSWSRGLSR